jgi:hypothetical protein
MSPRTPKPSGRSERRKELDTETDLRRRRAGFRPERDSFLILCEGKTEKAYFTGMRSRRGPQIDIDDPACDHVGLVREAIRRRSDEYTAVWCVLDTELDPKLTNRIVAAAKDDEIHLALSTPCFEVWLILHHEDHTAPFQSAEQAKKKLTDLLEHWSEGSTKFADFKDGVANACSRARHLDPTGDNLLKNPSTTAWKLVETLHTPTTER